MSRINAENIADFAAAQKRISQLRAETYEAELRDLIHSGREFLIALEDAELNVHEETGKEFRDVTKFRRALDSAAKAVQP